MVFLKRARWWRWALVSPDGVAPSQIVGVSASVNLPLHHKVKKFSSQSSGTGSPGWSRKRGRKTVLWCGGGILKETPPPDRGRGVWSVRVPNFEFPMLKFHKYSLAETSSQF